MKFRRVENFRLGIASFAVRPARLKVQCGTKAWLFSCEVQAMDAAYWVKGCSSLGLGRYAVLLAIGDNPKAARILFDGVGSGRAPASGGLG
jgi:uncharacterized protein (DUF2252 family)